MRSWRHVLVALAISVLAACQPQPKPENFVGKWKSSRLATPLVLQANGDWEIRGDNEPVLQYGVWQLRERNFIWSVKLDGQLQHDPNVIVSFGARHFELRERDGSVTRFDRID
jgi:hypothetical protein